METTTRTPHQSAADLHAAITEINDVVSEGRRIIAGINDKINADIEHISLKYQIGEKPLRKVSNNEQRSFNALRKERYETEPVA